MKKLLIIFSALSLLTSCSQKDYSNVDIEEVEKEETLSTFIGVITEIDGHKAKVEINSSQIHVIAYSDYAEVNLGTTPEKFSVGEEIVVYYKGDLKEGDILKVDEVKVISYAEYQAQQETETENN